MGEVADTEDPPLCPLMASAFGIIIIIIRIIRIFCLLNIYNVRLYKYFRNFTSSLHESFKADIMSLFTPNLHMGELASELCDKCFSHGFDYRRLGASCGAQPREAVRLS